MKFQQAALYHFPRSHSDHHPCLLTLKRCNSQQALKKPFQFQAAWLEDYHFKPFLEDFWKHTDGSLQTRSLASQPKLQDGIEKFLETSFTGGHGVWRDLREFKLNWTRENQIIYLSEKRSLFRSIIVSYGNQKSSGYKNPDLNGLWRVKVTQNTFMLLQSLGGGKIEFCI